MSYKDKWNLILDDKRFRPKTSESASDARNPFENDYGRLISSAPVRRLQDKTQVFSLEQSDYVRTRLTHSLEVSYLASSIGQSVEEFLINKGEIHHLLNIKMQYPKYSLLTEADIKQYSTDLRANFLF